MYCSLVLFRRSRATLAALLSPLTSAQVQLGPVEFHGYGAVFTAHTDNDVADEQGSGHDR
jgi:hypothetical protein